jgi:hypothetical protein
VRRPPIVIPATLISIPFGSTEARSNPRRINVSTLAERSLTSNSRLRSRLPKLLAGFGYEQSMLFVATELGTQLLDRMFEIAAFVKCDLFRALPHSLPTRSTTRANVSPHRVDPARYFRSKFGA